MASGLLEKEEDNSLPIQPQEIDQSSKNFLSVYIEDVERKLAVFDDMASRIGLFQKIINSKFSYKEIMVDREKGFILSLNIQKELEMMRVNSYLRHHFHPENIMG
jgi:hypothetical protein